MRIEGIIWLRDVVDKLIAKHGVETYEVEQVFGKQFESLDEMVRHFDTHDWGDYLAQMPQVEFDVDIKQRIHLAALRFGR